MSYASIDLTDNRLLSNHYLDLTKRVSSLASETMAKLLKGQSPSERIQEVFMQHINDSWDLITDKNSDIVINNTQTPQEIFQALIQDYRTTSHQNILYHGITMTKEEAMDSFYINHCEYCLEPLNLLEKLSKTTLLCNSCDSTISSEEIILKSS